MTDTPEQIKAAKSFATALASNIKLLNAFIAAERRIIQIDPRFSTAALDNFLVAKGYNCTVDQVSRYGAPILSDPSHWAGTYYTQLCKPGQTEWSPGPRMVIGEDSSVVMDGVTEPTVKFDYLNMTFPEANLIFYMASPGTHEGNDSDGAKSSRVKAFLGTYLGQKIVALVEQPTGPKQPSKNESTFMSTLDQLAKYMGQINQCFMIYDLIKKATNAQNTGDEAAVGEVRGELSKPLTEVSQSQGELATQQQSAIDTEAGENGTSLEEAADALREMQADDLGVEPVDDVAEAQLDGAGETIAEVPIEEGGLDITASLGEEAVGELTVDALLEDALLLVLL
jgi:hypothetical protein